jgi:hypothetical protein
LPSLPLKVIKCFLCTSMKMFTNLLDFPESCRCSLDQFLVVQWIQKATSLIKKGFRKPLVATRIGVRIVLESVYL